jgi:hypothetical protein
MSIKEEMEGTQEWRKNEAFQVKIALYQRYKSFRILRLTGEEKNCSHFCTPKEEVSVLRYGKGRTFAVVCEQYFLRSNYSTIVSTQASTATCPNINK